MTDQPPILDTTVIDELRASVAGDASFLRDLFGTYLAEGPEHLEAMAAAAASGDAEAIIRPAHTLKSSSASLGAMRLAQLAREIEFAGRSEETAVLAEMVAAARGAWQETVREMERSGLG